MLSFDSSWQMRRGLLSPEYTTNINQLPSGVFCN
ncbi:DUF4113 domain-containing protein [Xenorhabdus innexi]